MQRELIFRDLLIELGRIAPIGGEQAGQVGDRLVARFVFQLVDEFLHEPRVVGRPGARRIFVWNHQGGVPLGRLLCVLGDQVFHVGDRVGQHLLFALRVGFLVCSLANRLQHLVRRGAGELEGLD